jgi:hypothetical protein
MSTSSIFRIFGAAAWLTIGSAALVPAAAQSSDQDAIDSLRNTNVSLLDLGLRELRLYVEDTLTRAHPPGLTPIRPTAYMLQGIDDIWIEVGYAPDKSSDASPDCKAALTETARLLIQPTDASLPLSDPFQPGLLRMAEMFESAGVGEGGAAATGRSMAVMRHIRIFVTIRDASKNAELSHCKARLLDL